MQQPVPVKVYSTSWCPFCDRAKNLLDSKGIAYDNINIETEFPTDPFGELERVTSGKSVPQIVIGDKNIGGYNELVTLQRNGDLKALLSPATT